MKNLDVGDIKSHIFVKCALFMSNYDNYDSCHIRGINIYIIIRVIHKIEN